MNGPRTTTCWLIGLCLYFFLALTPRPAQAGYYYVTNEVTGSRAGFLDYEIDSSTIVITGFFPFPSSGGILTGGSITPLNIPYIAALNIPETIDGFPIVAIGRQAFRSVHLGRVTIPSTLKDIGYEAFQGTRLSQVNIPDGVRIGVRAFAINSLTNITIPRVSSMDSEAFAHCYGLTNVTMLNGANTIGDYAFFDCRELVNITIPSTVTNIGAGAFRDCDHLFKVNLPNGLIQFGDHAFSECDNLSRIAVPKTVKTIGAGLFSGCGKLTQLTVDSLNPFFSSKEGVIFNKTQTRIVACTAAKGGSYTVPRTVTVIGAGAFERTSWNSLIVAGSVTLLEDRAFGDCGSLYNVYFEGSPPSVGANVFYGADETTVYYLAGTKGWGTSFGGRPTALWPAPTTPSGLMASTHNTNAISLRWDSADNVSGYIVLRGVATNLTRIASLAGSVSSFVDSGLAAETRYYYSIQATNRAGLSVKSAPIVAMTLPMPPKTFRAKPAAPNVVEISWENSSSNANYFTIFRSLVQHGPYGAIATLDATTTNYQDHGVHSGLTYYYVAKVNASGWNSPISSEATVPLPSGLSDNFTFRNTNGQFSMWVMNQTNFVHYASITNGPPANTGWRVVTFADFNGDNNADILWQNTNGNIMTWLMQGTNFVRRQFLPAGTAASSGWRIYAANDLTGDGKADFLWRNTNGALKYWQMDGTNFVGEFSLRTGQPATNGWTIAGTADMDGNGSSDIVWSNTNGANAVWLMNQTNYLRTVGLRSGYPAANGWKLSLLTDLNSDRKTDFVWEKNDGRLEAWLMNGTNFVRSITLRTNAGAISGWRLVGPR